MSQRTVLFADDHFPDFDIPADDQQAIEVVRLHHRPRYPDSDAPIFLKFHRYCKCVESDLKDANYAVTSVNHYDDAITVAKTHHFDIAIVDLGWFNDDSYQGNNRPNAGWDICNEIDKGNEERGDPPTLHIVLSTRFNDEQKGPLLLSQAAKDGRLPFVKINDSPVNLNALNACTQFLQTTLDRASPDTILRQSLSDLQRTSGRYLDEPLAQFKTWATAALICACISFLVILAGVFGAVHGSMSVGVLTSVNAVISGAVATFFYKRLDKVQGVMSKQLTGMRHDIAKLLDKLT